MKPLFAILKITALIALVLAMTLAYTFFRTWQKNERPELLSAQWQQDQVALGSSAVLEVDLRVPWHREINSAIPFSFPEALLPVRKQARFEKSDLTLSGYRNWSLSVPLVVTDQKVGSGLTLSLPLARTQRISPSSVNIPLPPLAVTTPAELPRDPENPQAFLNPEPPAAQKMPAVLTDEVRTYWIHLTLAALTLTALLFFLLRKAGIIAATPPWEKAHKKLDALSENDSPVALLSKLTDILKQYTSDRFNVGAAAKTSTEFLATLRSIDDLTPEHIEHFPWLARIADAAKFAGQQPPPDAGPRAISIVRDFVKETTPEEKPDA